MEAARHLGAEVLWLAATGAVAFFFWKTVLTIEVAAALITLTLMQVERRFR